MGQHSVCGLIVRPICASVPSVWSLQALSWLDTVMKGEQLQAFDPMSLSSAWAIETWYLKKNKRESCLYPQRLKAGQEDCHELCGSLGYTIRLSGGGPEMCEQWSYLVPSDSFCAELWRQCLWVCPWRLRTLNRTLKDCLGGSRILLQPAGLIALPEVLFGKVWPAESQSLTECCHLPFSKHSPRRHISQFG